MFRNNRRKDPFDGEYVGNIWGWKLSYIGLGVILFFLFLVLFRQWQTGASMFDPPPASSLDSTTIIKE